MCFSIAPSHTAKATSLDFAAGSVDARAVNPAVFSKTYAAKKEVLTARSHRLRRCALNLCDLGQEKQIREERTQMNGSVQVVDQRRADGGLRQDQLDGGERIARVALEHREECAIFFHRIEAFLFHCGRTAIGQTRDGFHGAAQIFANLSARPASFIAGKPLRRISQHELVTFFNGVAAIPDISQHLLIPLVPHPRMPVRTGESRRAIAADRVLPDKNPGSSNRRSSTW